MSSTPPLAAPSSSLIRAVLAGRPGWDRLVDLCAPVLVGWLRQRGLSPQDAEDVCQDVLLTLVRFISRYDPDQPFIPWLFALARSRFIDAHRRRAGKPAGQGGSDFLERVNGVASPEGEDEEDFRLDLLRAALRQVRAEVGETVWAAFQRLVLDQVPAAAVAAELNATRAQVYKRAHQVRTRVRELLNIPL